MTVAALVIASSIPTEAFACWVCKYSPNYWGFCRGGYSRGHGDCIDIVEDAWSGRTDCQINQWGTCGRNIGECAPDDEGCCPGCEVYEAASANQPCTWTDRSASTLV